MEVTPSPHFLSRGQTFRAVIGDTLVLPCEVEDLAYHSPYLVTFDSRMFLTLKSDEDGHSFRSNADVQAAYWNTPKGPKADNVTRGTRKFEYLIGSYVLLWRRGSAVLTAANLMVTRDSRFRLVDGYNLQISNVMPQDAGDYVCQISDGDNRDQIHTVEILVPPSIRMNPANGQLKARKGGTVTLECKASGNPVPTIFWSRKDNLLPSGDQSVEGFSITLEKVDRHQAGVYQCTANNGVGEPVTVDMQLDILYPPEIEVERSWVHSGEGYEAQLVCIVHGEPAPEVTWYQDSLPLDPSERRTTGSRGNKHTLTIRDVQASDFGNYSCVGENTLGRAKNYMELSGRPSPAEFLSAPFSRFKDSYNLTWVIESYPPLEEVRLLYRKLHVNETFQNAGKWHDVILRPGGAQGAAHAMSYNIRGLDRGSAFEAIVQARNHYGWNEVSDLYQFYTRGAGESQASQGAMWPSSKSQELDMDDMELVASSSSFLSAMSPTCSTVFMLVAAAVSL